MLKQRLGRCQFDNNEEEALAVCEWLRIQQYHLYEVPGWNNYTDVILKTIFHLNI